MIRAVIDTNVLVSALISPSGNEALLLLAVKQGLVRPCFSHAVLKEYSEVLTRPGLLFPRMKSRRSSTFCSAKAIFCTLLRFPVFLPTPRMMSLLPAP